MSVMDYSFDEVPMPSRRKEKAYVAEGSFLARDAITVLYDPFETGEDMTPSDVREFIKQCVKVVKDVTAATPYKVDPINDSIFKYMCKIFEDHVVGMMVLLEELDGDDFVAWMDELDELGYTFIIFVKFFAGNLFAPRGFTSDLIHSEPVVVHSSLKISSEWYDFIKYIYEGSLSPWTMFFDNADFERNLTEIDPRLVTSAFIEWGENLNVVDFSTELSAQSVNVATRFLDV
jgi:hypothetical protein